MNLMNAIAMNLMNAIAVTAKPGIPMNKKSSVTIMLDPSSRRPLKNSIE